MDKDFIKDTVINTINVYKTAFQEGYVKGLEDARAISKKILNEIEIEMIKENF